VKSSIMSYPERGKWGKASWRGNASGYVYKDLFEQLRPSVFVDPMVGSGTSVEVAREMGIEAYGLDLHSGFNAVRDSILAAVGKEACLCVSHPPYGDLLHYSGSVWGDAAHPDDLSRCADDAEFHERMQLCMLNQRDAVRPGGYYGTLIGDRRRNGVYASYQAEIITRMPSDELAGVLIKTQHNCVSDGRQYAAMALPRILHEYLLLFRKKSRPILLLLSTMAREQQARMSGTWKNIVRCVLLSLGGSAPLTAIYDKVADAAPDKLAANPHWRDKVRQVVNSNPNLFCPVRRGEWALSGSGSESAVPHGA
jgi:hypothetical protein